MNENNQYYDGTKLLSLTDANGEKPEIFICTTNRSAGKTTYFGRLVVNRFLKNGKKFGLIYRYNYELDDCAGKFFKELSALFFNCADMRSERKASGVYHELFLDDKPCGYALSLNNADQIKKLSHFFSDIDSLLFDEFQSETNHYCPNEVQKLISVHTSIARGGGKQVRYVPIYMLSNAVSIINPYYTALNVSNRLSNGAKFIRGNGFVIEQGFIETASKAQKESGFNKAFSGDKYVEYSTQNIYLNDNVAFVGTPDGKSRYICTIKYNGVEFGVREYADAGIIYCDDKPDTSFLVKVTVTTDDHDINYVMLKRNDVLLSMLRYYFERGCFRFKDLRCKEAILKSLSY